MSEITPLHVEKFFFHSVVEEDYSLLVESMDLSAFQETEWLICGATGMVPAYLVDFLGWLIVEHGMRMRLHLWVRSEEKAKERFPWYTAEFVQLHVPDWKDPSRWSFPSVDYVVHAASPATPAACAADPYGVQVCNVLIPQRMVDTLPRERLRRVLYMSSSEVYGDSSSAYPDESQLGVVELGAPRSLYPLAKRLGESIFMEASSVSQVPVRIARLFHTYGPGMDVQGDPRAFADLMGMCVRGESINLRGDGQARRAYCYLRDTLSAMLTLLMDPGAPLVANVGNPSGILSVTELAELLARIGGQQSPVSVAKKTDAQSLSDGVLPNIGRLMACGWKPETCPEDGFSRTFRYYST
jgi:nucleoside-diphosphate-sugar epimerase